MHPGIFGSCRENGEHVRVAGKSTLGIYSQSPSKSNSCRFIHDHSLIVLIKLGSWHSHNDKDMIFERTEVYYYPHCIYKIGCTLFLRSRTDGLNADETVVVDFNNMYVVYNLSCCWCCCWRFCWCSYRCKCCCYNWFCWFVVIHKGGFCCRCK